MFRLVVLVEDALGVELLVPRRGLVHRVVVAHQDLGVSRNLFRGPGIGKDVVARLEVKVAQITH